MRRMQMMNSVKRMILAIVVSLAAVLPVSAQVGTASQQPMNGEVQTAQFGEYLVGVDDVLDVVLLKPESVASRVTVAVAPDGAITVPYIGNVKAKGRTLPMIQEEVERRLADGYVEFPVVSVALRQTNSQKFTIYGQVIKPGSYPVEQDMTLLEALTVAGGLISPGATGNIRLMRPQEDADDKVVFEGKIESILNGEHAGVRVQTGDSVVVKVNKYFVYGQVTRPGGYPLEEDMTLLHAITVAGGFTESGATGTVKLLRPQTDGGEFEVVEADITDIMNGDYQHVTIEAEDTIVVSVDKFFLYGEINRPGRYPVEKNTTPLSAIAQAGGFIESGSTGKVKVLRPLANGGESTIFNADISEILEGGDQDIEVLPGDTIVVSSNKFYVTGQVARPGAYPVRQDLTLMQAISLAGGFNETGATGRVRLLRPLEDGENSKIVETGITDLLNGAFRDVVVRSGDTITVSLDKFFVYGEVNRPGIYPLEKSTTPLNAIAMAGGFNKFGSANRVKLLRLNEGLGVYDTVEVNIKNLIAGQSVADTFLQPGDVVVVSESMF